MTEGNTDEVETIDDDQIYEELGLEDEERCAKRDISIYIYNICQLSISIYLYIYISGNTDEVETIDDDQIYVELGLEVEERCAN